MKGLIIALLETANEGQLRRIYNFIRAYLKKD